MRKVLEKRRVSERDLWPCACAIKINLHKNPNIFIQQNVCAIDKYIKSETLLRPRHYQHAKATGLGSEAT